MVQTSAAKAAAEFIPPATVPPLDAADEEATEAMVTAVATVTTMGTTTAKLKS